MNHLFQRYTQLHVPETLSQTIVTGRKEHRQQIEDFPCDIEDILLIAPLPDHIRAQVPLFARWDTSVSKIRMAMNS